MAQDEAPVPTWAEVRFLSERGGGQHVYQARVEVSQKVEISHTMGYEDMYPYPQYRVVQLEQVESVPLVS